MKEPQNPLPKISNNKASDTTIKILGDEGRRGSIRSSQSGEVLFKNSCM